MSKSLKSVGIIHSPYKTKDQCPIQGAYASDDKAMVEVFAEYEDGLKDVEGFSHIILLYLFDRAGKIELMRPTFLDDRPHGVFASRHPCRPNGIGLSVVRLIKRDKNVLEVAGIDVLDGTPLVDIKPYVAKFDSFPEASEGWISSRKWRPKPPGRE